MDDFPKAHRRETLELQLTAMIDIFSMIVIFLIMGTVFGAADAAPPASVQLPESISAESLESAPKLIIDGDQVIFDPLALKVPVAAFHEQAAGISPEISSLKTALTDYIAKLPASSRGSGVLLSVIADHKLGYADLFDVIKIFRESGFETLMFLTTAKSSEGAAR